MDSIGCLDVVLLQLCLVVDNIWVFYVYIVNSILYDKISRATKSHGTPGPGEREREHIEKKEPLVSPVQQRDNKPLVSRGGSGKGAYREERAVGEPSGANGQ